MPGFVGGEPEWRQKAAQKNRGRAKKEEKSSDEKIRRALPGNSNFGLRASHGLASTQLKAGKPTESS